MMPQVMLFFQPISISRALQHSTGEPASSRVTDFIPPVLSLIALDSQLRGPQCLHPVTNPQNPVKHMNVSVSLNIQQEIFIYFQNFMRPATTEEQQKRLLHSILNVSTSSRVPLSDIMIIFRLVSFDCFLSMCCVCVCVCVFMCVCVCVFVYVVHVCVCMCA